MTVQTRDEDRQVRWQPRFRKRNFAICKFCSAANVVRNGTKKGTQYWLCRSCGRAFVDNGALPRKKYATAIIATSVFAYYDGLPVSEICDLVERTTGLRPADSTVYRWIEEIRNIGIDESKKHRPILGGVWNLREEKISIPDGDYWLMDLVDAKTGFVASIRLGSTCNANDIRALVASAYQRTGRLPSRIVVASRTPRSGGIEVTIGGSKKRIKCGSQHSTGRPGTADTSKLEFSARQKAIRGAYAIGLTAILLGTYTRAFGGDERKRNRPTATSSVMSTR